MAPLLTHLPHVATGRFSSLVLDYLAGSESLQPFYRHAPDWAGISAAIEARKDQATDRETLCRVLESQYAGTRLHEAVRKNLEALRSEQTFTVCTAHQPNLATGYLYFVYKILHAVRLAEDLSAQHPEQHFVPVYYMGSEDADLEELGTFRYGEKKFLWDGGGQRGAVGRMRTESLKPLLEELFSLLGPPGAATDRLKTILQDAYLGHDTIAAATRYLVNELFGQYGLVVLDADDAAFKRAMRPVFSEDLFENSSEVLAKTQAGALKTQGYDAQAYPRAINLFYLTDAFRERIEKEEEAWKVLNTDLTFSKDELLTELDRYPERFSPNVVLRGLLQETILPNVAFIGGGAEVAYWLQLRPLFEHHRVLFPPVILRATVQWIAPQAARLQQALGLSTEQLFADESTTIGALIAGTAGERWRLDSARQTLASLEESLRAQVSGIDPTLDTAAGAAIRTMQKQLQHLEAKALRAEKRNHKTDIDRVHRLRDALFPGGGLQERTENFLPYYAQYGPEFFEWIKAGIDPLGKTVLVGSLPEA